MPNTPMTSRHPDRLSVLAWPGQVPTLLLSFPLTSYDFGEPLSPAEFQHSERGWLDYRQMSIRLLLTDTLITGQPTDRAFALSEHESNEIRRTLHS